MLRFYELVHLTMHHTIEEQHLFPFLAQKMPQFPIGFQGQGCIYVHTKEFMMVSEHPRISTMRLMSHVGLEKLLAKWRKSPSTYSPSEMRSRLDGFREVLFHHLDEEVSSSCSRWQIYAVLLSSTTGC